MTTGTGSLYSRENGQKKPTEPLQRGADHPRIMSKKIGFFQLIYKSNNYISQ
jgi:hypothetical protein